MKPIKKIFNKEVFVFILSTITSLYWLNYYQYASSNLDKSLYSESTFDSVRLNKYHSYKGVEGSWNIQHQYAPYLEAATKSISLDHGTRFFESDNFTASLSNVNSSDFKVSSLDSKIDNQFILGLQHTFRFKISSSVSHDYLQYFAGRYAVLKGTNSDYVGLVSKVTEQYVEVRAPLPMGEIIKSIQLPPAKKGVKSFEALLDSERMGLVRGGLVNQFTGNSGTYIYVRTFSAKDSRDFIQGEATININGKLFNIDDIIPLGMQDFLISITGSENYQPYVDSRKNIVVINVSNNFSERTLSLKISNLTDKKYVFGLDRLYSIKVKDIDGFLNNGKLNVEQSPWLLSAKSVEGNVVTFDLLDLIKRHVSESSRCESLDEKTECNIFSRDFISKDNLELLKDVYNEVYSTIKISPFKEWIDGGNARIAYENQQDQVETLDEYTTKRDSFDDFNIWEIYPGSILNLYYGKQNPAPVEMLIHVLGKETRANYYDSFKKTKPDYVSFAKPERFTPWLLNWHWTFFKEIIHNYESVVDLDEFALWKRMKSMESTYSDKSQPFYSNNLPYTVTLGSEASDMYKLYTATLKYKTDNPLLKLPLLGKSARYFVVSTASVTTLPASIPWSEEVWQFPVVVKGREQVTFDLLETSDFLNSSDISIESITLQEEDVPQDSIIKMFLDYGSMR
ncbi:hypothetical protein [Vibrio sp. RM-69-4]|uniref:hypothetical protein n=1 Tax=Vibrio sp. RM-69-4 TaxID=2950157 RepID=UPI00215C4ECC|nr:hypothetical protein [Vibrio sp. RM-69-4]MCR9421159.1 hypothetical protein [Vibrio sp. RM-69-4]